MILMGDEVRRTQLGNNNAYCHDDESIWFDWTLLEKHADMRRFVSLLTERRLLRTGTRRAAGQPDQLHPDSRQKAWHGVKLGQPDWGDDFHSIAFNAAASEERLDSTSS